MPSPPDSSAGRFSEFTDDDARELARLLAKYATCCLDQFELWKLEFRWGAVYVDISRRPYQGASLFAYTRIWPPAPDGGAPEAST